jgi:hypothetical protein
MLDSGKAKEVEAAWLAHEPERAAISNELWRSLRAWKRELLPTAAVIEKILKKEQLARSLIEPAVRRRGIARQRKLGELRRLLPGANVKISFKDILEVSWLSPKQAILADPQHRGEQQDCTLVCFMIAWPTTPRSIRAHSGWALECADHALARLLQRAPRADLRAVLFQAGLAFLGGDAQTVMPLVGQDASVYLPAGDGAFATSVVGAKTADGQKHFVYSRASTWLSESMLRAEQKPLPPAASAERSVVLQLWRWHEDGMIAPPLRSPTETVQREDNVAPA